MKRKKSQIFLFFQLLFLQLVFQNSNAQVFFEWQPVSRGNTHAGTFYGTENLYKDVPYARIKGSPFWNDIWTPASLYDNNNKLIARLPVKLNLASGELYYLNKGEPLVVADDLVRKVVIHTDTTTWNVKAVFVNYLPYIYTNKQKINDFVQIFHVGYAILIKYVQRQMKVGDSALGTQKRYYFVDEINYFIQVNNKAEPIRRLSKDTIFQLLPGAFQMQGWIAERKLDMRKEEDVIQFIEYYNSIREKEGK